MLLVLTNVVNAGLSFRKCGEKPETTERNRFFTNKTAGRGRPKQGSGRQFSDFRRTSGLGAHFALSKSPHSLKKFLKQP